MKNPLIDIRPDHWAIVADILRRRVSDCEVWAFGSRAKWNAKEYSDLDLAVMSDQPIGLSVSAALADDFSESDLPFKVDVVDWATTSESFRKIIERDKVVVQKARTILGTLDDKIELNRRMNETLEAMARALFKSWFVDFDPVRAKAEGRRPSGMDAETAKLFPSKFEKSDVGEVPKGWTALPLYDIATYINRAAYTAFQPNDARRGLPIIKIAELKAGVTPQTKFSDVSMPEKYRIARGDILFSWSGNPDTCIDTFVWAHGPGWLNQHIFLVVPHREHERAFVLATLKYLKPVFAEIARNKQSTGLGHVTAEDMKRLLVTKPPDRLVRVWSAIASPLLGRAFQNEIEIHSLSTVRDTILPKLLAGEIELVAAEHFTEISA